LNTTRERVQTLCVVNTHYIFSTSRLPWGIGCLATPRFLQTVFTVLLIVLSPLPSIAGLTLTFPVPKALAQSPPSAPILDGTGTAMGQCGSQGGYVCELLTTSRANDIVIAIATCENDYGIQYYCDQYPNTIKDSADLSFSLHGSYCYNNTTVGRSSCVWDYYAVAPSPLNNDNITGYFDPTLMHRLFAFAVSGADLHDMFDPGLPQGQHCPYIDQHFPYDCTLNFTTSPTASPLEFLFVTIPDDDAPTCSYSGIPPSQGWSLLQSDGGNTEIDYQTANVWNLQNYALTCSTKSDPLIEVADGIRGPVPSEGPEYTMIWMGYDWDGLREETLTLNGQFLASLPDADSPQNAGVYTSFSLNISSLVVQGANTLTLTHANWDCAVSDNVKNLQISDQTGLVFSDSTEQPLSCTQSLTYHFNVSPASVGGTVVPTDRLGLILLYLEQSLGMILLLISVVVTYRRVRQKHRARET